MAALELVDLVRNGTMSPSIAATLASAAEERRSLLFAAIPRLAGKTTTLAAALRHRPPGTPIHHLSRTAGPALGIPDQPDGGYLLVSEISPVGFDDYFWGGEVRRAFAAVAAGGFALATALHASGIEEAFQIVTGDNGVPDAHASAIDLFVYIRSLGPHWTAPTRRVVAEVHEVESVTRGLARSRLLHRWDEAGDRFEDHAAVTELEAARARHLVAFEEAAAG